MTKLSEIREFVGDKSILIVGNGPEWTEPEAGVVVRLNWGIEHQCDIWVDGFSYTHFHKGHPIPDHYKYVVRLHKHAKNTEKHPGYKQSERDYACICEECGVDRPSTGMMALWWFKEHFPNNDKMITGFNGNTNRYTGEVYTKKVVHNWPQERKMQERWVNDEIFRTV